MECQPRNTTAQEEPLQDCGPRLCGYKQKRNPVLYELLQGKLTSLARPSTHAIDGGLLVFTALFVRAGHQNPCPTQLVLHAPSVSSVPRAQ